MFSPRSVPLTFQLPTRLGLSPLSPRIPRHNALHCVPQYAGMFFERMQTLPGTRPSPLTWLHNMLHRHTYIWSSSVPLCVVWVLGDVHLVGYTHNHFHPIDSPPCHVHAPICSNALFRHKELPVRVQIHVRTCILFRLPSLLPNTATVLITHPRLLLLLPSVWVPVFLTLSHSSHMASLPSEKIINIDLRSPNPAFLCFLATLRLLPISNIVSLASSPSAPTPLSPSPPIFPTVLIW